MESKRNKNTCDKCRYWNPTMEDIDGIDTYGECRRHAPTQKRSGDIVSLGTSNGETVLGVDCSRWEIITHRLNWCGEWGGVHAEQPKVD